MPKKASISVFSNQKFDGKVYCWHSWWDTKSAARAETVRLRKAGYPARVKEFKRSWGTIYGVYNR